MIGAGIVVLTSKNSDQRAAIPAAIPPSGPTQADIDKAAADRQAEAERVERERREGREAMERLEKSVRDKFRADVKACASIVRQRSDSGIYKGFSKFDAYVTGEYGETVQFFGTAEERFHFEKCMADRGVPLSNQNADSGGK